MEKHRTSSRQTSEVLPRKYGGLGTRSPMFLAHSRASFPPFSTLRRGLRGKNGAEIRGHCRTLHPNLPYTPCRIHESASFSALEGTLHIVIIFEGLHPFSASHPCPSSQSLLPGIAKHPTPAVSPGMRAGSGVGAETYLPDTFHPCIAYRPDILCPLKCHTPCTFHHENCSASILFY